MSAALFGGAESESADSGVVLQRSKGPASVVYASRPTIQILRGPEAILRSTEMLRRLASRCGQTGAMQDIVYYLSKPGILKRVPQLILFFAEERSLETDEAADNLVGALLLFEYQVFGTSLFLFTTNDRSGRNTLVCPPAWRSKLASYAADFLIEQGAHTVMISYRSGQADTGASSGEDAEFPGSGRVAVRRATRQQDIPDYLPLAATYEATLAAIGQRTRSNMRYNRRRAEAKLGCTFVPAVAISRAEFLAFNRQTMYAVSDDVAGWRYDIHPQLESPLLMGLRDRDGQWLALIGARRFALGSEILWQMNRDGLPIFSLSLVARSYFMEHEIANGSRALYIEGGTSHPIQYSFERKGLTHLVVLRHSSRALLTKTLARHVAGEDNELARMLSDPETVWH